MFTTQNIVGDIIYISFKEKDKYAHIGIYVNEGNFMEFNQTGKPHTFLIKVLTRYKFIDETFSFIHKTHDYWKFLLEKVIRLS